MPSIPAALFCLGVLALASTASAQEKRYDLGLDWPPVVGWRSEHRVLSRLSYHTILRTDGTVVKDVLTEKEVRVAYAREILAVRNDEIAELRLTFHEVVCTQKGQAVPMSFLGKVVRYVRGEDGTSAFTWADGTPLGDAECDFLAHEVLRLNQAEAANARKLFAPKTPVRAGESWTPEVAGFAQAAPLRSDLARSRGTLALESIESRDGRDWGKIAGTIELTATGFGSFVFAEPLPVTFAVAVNGCIDHTEPDGTTTWTMQAKGARDLQAPPAEPGSSMELEWSKTYERSTRTVR